VWISDIDIVFIFGIIRIMEKSMKQNRELKLNSLLSARSSELPETALVLTSQFQFTTSFCL